MSDTLRDRIAAVLFRSLADPLDDYEGESGDWLEAADAVIAELKRSECGGDLCECRQCRVIRILEEDDE